MSILEKNDNILKNFRFHKNKKSILEKQNIKKDDRNLVSKVWILKVVLKTVCQNVLFKIDFLQVNC